MSVDAKAVQLVDKVECVAWKDGPGAVYAVPSQTDPADFHVVTDLTRLGLGQGLRCDCQAGAHLRVCSHSVAVGIRRERTAERRWDPAVTRGRPVAGGADTLIDDDVCAWAGGPAVGVERLAPAIPAPGPETSERRRTPAPSAGGAAGAARSARPGATRTTPPTAAGAPAARKVMLERRRRALGPESGWHRAGCPDWRLNASEADRRATHLEANGRRAEAINLAQGVALVEVQDLAARGHPLVAVFAGWARARRGCASADTASGAESPGHRRGHCRDGARRRALLAPRGPAWPRPPPHPALGDLGPCWLWVGPHDRDGYGSAPRTGGEVRAHRVSWVLAHGPIPPGRWVLHACDVPACVNPAHLFLGDHTINMRDRSAKGRTPDSSAAEGRTTAEPS